MAEILGYGEDAFTFWAFKRHLSKILEELKDKTAPPDCLIFSRPSFGRSGVAEFGEFDAIVASSQNIYLIESKWDRLLRNKRGEIALMLNQVLRHKIFSWYLKNWNTQKYSNKWEKFRNDKQDDFAGNFTNRRIAPPGSRLAKDLEFVLNKLQEHCKRYSCEYREPRNALLYFYGEKSTEIRKVAAGDLHFEVVNIDYSQYISDDFITLDC